MKLEDAFRKALESYGKVYDYPAIVQYEDGEFECLPSASLKDILYTGRVYEVVYVMKDVEFLGGRAPTDAAQNLQDQDIGKILTHLRIESLI